MYGKDLLYLYEHLFMCFVYPINFVRCIRCNVSMNACQVLYKMEYSISGHKRVIRDDS